MRTANITQRVGTLRQQAGRRAGYEQDRTWDQFRVSTSSPPDKRLHMRGGLLYASGESYSYAFGYRGVQIQPQVIDLTNAVQVGRAIAFATAHRYQGYGVVIAFTETETIDPVSPAFTLVGSGVEYATAAEAEEALEAWLYADQVYWWGFPLCGIILRNDGTVGGGCPILPVDMVNRGRSYLWPADIRPFEYLVNG